MGEMMTTRSQAELAVLERIQFAITKALPEAFYSKRMEIAEAAYDAMISASPSPITLEEIVEVLEGLMDAETVPHHVGYDNGAGGGNYVYEDAILTTGEEFTRARSLLSRLASMGETKARGEA